MLRDSWEWRQEGLFLFSWEGPDPRNTVEHIWWGVSHNDFFGRGESSRNKNNTDPTFCQRGTGVREPVRDHSSSLLTLRIPSHSKKSLLVLGSLRLWRRPRRRRPRTKAVKETEEQEKWSSLPRTAHGLEGVTLLHGPRGCGGLPYVPLSAWCKSSPSRGHWDPRKAKPSEDPIPVQLVSSGQE